MTKNQQIKEIMRIQGVDRPQAEVIYAIDVGESKGDVIAVNQTPAKNKS